MTRKLLLRIAAGLVLFTFVGHTFGALQEVPVDQVEVKNLMEQMKSTMVPFPIGSPKSVEAIMRGANFSLSVYLLVAGFIFVMFASGSLNTREQRLILPNSLGMGVVAIISIYCFFPLPAACLGVAALLGLVSLKTKA